MKPYRKNREISQTQYLARVTMMSKPRFATVVAIRAQTP